jgi:hypothetical protein
MNAKNLSDAVLVVLVHGTRPQIADVILERVREAAKQI